MFRPRPPTRILRRRTQVRGLAQRPEGRQGGEGCPRAKVGEWPFAPTKPTLAASTSTEV